MALVLEGVSKSVAGQPHIHPTDLELAPGTMNVLLGPTLAGKTTLMRLMAGLDTPNTGKVLWQGDDVTGVRVQDRGVAMVYQQFINYPSMTVFDNIASPLKLRNLAAAEIRQQVEEVAELMKLTPMLARKPLELSGGQQQRCALARALVKNAGLVLLDEPLANLDYKLREELRVEIPKIFERSGAIFVYATTEPEEALLLGGNTATLWEGKVTQFGPTPEVYRNPQTATTARVFSDPPMNFLKVTKAGGKLHFGDGNSAPAINQLREVDDGNYLAGFRPNHVELHRHVEDAMEFETTLSVTEITGSETFVHLDHHGEPWVGLLHGVHELELGMKLPVYLDTQHAYIFSEGGALVAPAPYAQTPPAEAA
ncbi:MAG: ABC transporter ATP-binding protein [Pseudomonadota bacterium]